MSLQEIIEKAIPLSTKCAIDRNNALHRRVQLEKRILEYINLKVEEKLKQVEQPA